MVGPELIGIDREPIGPITEARLPAEALGCSSRFDFGGVDPDHLDLIMATPLVLVLQDEDGQHVCLSLTVRL